jgi:cupin 2 domain-containing protein
MNAENLFSDIPADLPEELFTTLLQAKGLRIERIVSQGHASAPGKWYDQAGDEWVILLSGRAVIEFEADSQRVELQPGSYLNIPAHVRHRIASTDAVQKSVWLAVHYSQ